MHEVKIANISLVNRDANESILMYGAYSHSGKFNFLNMKMSLAEPLVLPPNSTTYATMH